MSVFESPRYQQARDRMKGNPVILLMAAGIASVPLAEIAGEDGTPRSWFMNQANRAFADAEARNAGNPRYQPYPAGAPRHIGRVAEAVLAWGAEIRAAVAPLVAPAGTSPESAEVTRAIISMRTESLEAIVGNPHTLRLCDGCYQAATGLIAECEDGCDQDPGRTGLCLRDGPDDCQWCGDQGRLRDVPRSAIVHLLPTVGEEDQGLWHLHFADGAQGPYPSQRAAWDDWHAGARARRRREPAVSETPNAVARRGDLVVIHLRHRDWTAGQPRKYDDFWLGQVTSVTRAGLVRLYRPAGTFAWDTDGRGRPDKGQPLPSLWFERAAIKSQKEIDVPGALATAACHAWPGHEGHVRGYDTLAEVKAALRPHLLESLWWDRLRNAAAAWEAAWREARPLLSAAVRAHGEEFRRLSDLYDAAVTAANNAYREQHVQAAGTGSAAA